MAIGGTYVVASRSLRSLLCGKGLVEDLYLQPAPWWQQEELILRVTAQCVYIYTMWFYSTKCCALVYILTYSLLGYHWTFQAPL